MNEFADVERRLSQYRPAAPSDAARRRMAGLLHQKPQARARRARLIALAMAIAFLATMPWWVHRFSRDSDDAGPVPEDFAKAWAARPREPVAVPPTHAQVVVVLFNDWPCITCAILYPQLVRIIESFERTMPGAVTLVMRDWPWDSKCNPHVPVEMHPLACDLAAAVRMAGAHGRQPVVIDWVLSNRERLKDAAAGDRVRAELRRLLPGVDVDAEMTAELDRIRQDLGHTEVEITGTPTVFINGVRMNAASPESIEYGIRLELRRLNR